MVGKLRVITFLAPSVAPTYAYIVDYLGRELGYETELIVGSDYESVGDADLSFICGLPYVLRTKPRHPQPCIEALVAPVLRSERYQGRPIYFSDVIVHRDSAFHSFSDLRGCSWGYNEPESQSGYGITRYHLVTLGETSGYFGKVIRVGFHQKAIQMVADGELDASAIDSQVLAIAFRDQPKLRTQLRVIDTLGPSTIQPLVVHTGMADNLRRAIRDVLTNIHTDPAASAYLERGLFERFVPITDTDYDDIRRMLQACEQANLMTLE